MNNISNLLENLTPKQRELLLLKLNKVNKEKSSELSGEVTNGGGNKKNFSIPQLVKADFEGDFPLSFAQERQWMLEQMNPAAGNYNMSTGVTVNGTFDIESFEKACQEMIRRQESLRTVFKEKNGQPYQVIYDSIDFEVPLIDLSHIRDEEEKRAETRKILDAESRIGFNVEKPPLLKITLIRLEEKAHIVSLAMHHIISDGWSMEILISELSRLYDSFVTGKPAQLRDLPIQYKDYAIWQKSWLKDDVLEAHLDFWQKTLKDVSVLELPTDYPRPPVPSFRGNRIEFRIEPEKLKKLQELAKRENATLFMIMLAIWQTLLARYSNQDDISVGSFIANRNRTETENLIGFFINNLTFRTNFAGNPTFLEIIERVREIALNAYLHQDIPFELVLDRVKPERDMSRTRLFQAMMVLQNMPPGEVNLTNLSLNPIEETKIERSNFDLTLWLWEGSFGLGGQFEYSVDLFTEKTAERMVRHLDKIVETVLVNPQTRLAEIPLLDKEEEKTILETWNEREIYVDYSANFCRIFESRVEKNPGAVAVKFRDEELTYDELNQKANKLAHYLIKTGVKPENRVAICLERSVDMMVAVLGVLKSGAAYIPLDPYYPKERLLYIMEDSAASVLITQQQLLQTVSRDEAESLSEKAEKVSLFIIDSVDEFLKDESSENPSIEIFGENNAYLIYTSGSTRRPRGVQVTHNSIINAYYGWVNDYELADKTWNYLQMASFSFDVFVSDFVRALGTGGKLVICPEDTLLSPHNLYEYFIENEINCVEIVPAILRMLVEFMEENDKKFETVKLLVAGADAFYVKEFEKLKQLCGQNAKIFNSYGLTEATIDSTFYSDQADDLKPGQMIPIGKPFVNTKTYILDKFLKPVPLGISGELFIGGPSLARGYLNNSDLTADKFIPNPFSSESGARLYRTGDLAKYRADGNIEFLRRLDFQVKIRGFRIEVEEIEIVISDYPAVKQAIVTAVANGDNEKSLVAYFVKESDQEIEINDLKQYIREKLPAFMLPSAFVELEEFPLSPNGKIDRKALPEPEPENFVIEDNYVAPETPINEALVEIYEEVLRRKRIGIFDNFFDIGGHSLLATQVISRINKKFAIELPLREIFFTPNIAELSLTIEEILLEEIENSDELQSAQSETGEMQAPQIVLPQSLSAEAAPQIILPASIEVKPQITLPSSVEASEPTAVEVNPLINIITRTANRPKGLAKLVESIGNQTHRNIKHWITVDHTASMAYAVQYAGDSCEILQINKKEVMTRSDIPDPNTGDRFIYNLYLNDVLSKITEGWVIIIDDDDSFADNNAASTIVKNMQFTNDMIIYQMRYPDGTVLPDEDSFNQPPQLGRIGMPCITVHHSLAKQFNFDGWKCGDYRYISKIYEAAANKRWILQPIIQIGNRGGFGRRVDVKAEPLITVPRQKAAAEKMVKETFDQTA